MRPVTEITAEAENFRIEPVAGLNGGMIRRDPVKPEPEGTIILCAFRITGYRPDCDGSLMAEIEQIDRDGNTTGWTENAIGLYPSTDIVATLDEWRALFGANA